MEKSVEGLNEWQSLKKRMVINRVHALIHGAALAALFYYRITSISITTSLPHLLIFAAELVLSFQWLLSQGSKWNPVSRTACPDRLPADDNLPSVDVFVCTTDPVKEPSLGVMNTVISAMALDYPAHKLHVYLSDDGGSPVTFRAVKEAWGFAKMWIPFCRKYMVNNRCPQAYFMTEQTGDHHFLLRKAHIQKAYEDFKISLAKIADSTDSRVSRDHQPIIEVINDGDEMDKDPQMPHLVYVAREKRPFHSHRFKAGALNVLLRVSALISNSPYILVLDCDMYCNDPTSARQAMCFHLDPKLSPDLAFVQFPQRFYTLCDKDIYDGEFRYAWEKWEGLNGLKGPILSGTGFYIRREALYRSTQQLQKNGDMIKWFGSSEEFINSVYTHNKPNYPSDNVLQFLASCSYDNGTKWGEQVGFRYFAVVEDYFTGLILHCEGWKSVYYESSRARPGFLGTSPDNLGEVLVQHCRWSVGLNQVAFSRYSPLVYGLLRMSILQSMGYAEIAFYTISFLPLYILALLPQISLLQGIHLFPQLSSPFFLVFVFLFFSSQAKHLQEVLMTGYPTSTWITEQRMWMIRSFTSYFYANMYTIMDKIGLRKATFLPTNKAVDEAAAELYQRGVYNFEAPSVFMVPMCTLYMINMGSFVAGIWQAGKGNGMMLIESLIPLFGMILHLPLLQGMVVRKDKGRVPTNVSIVSLLLSSIVMAYASFAT
ncbi:cellulose synthase-like protein G2 isoform X2 [Salvia hispanica]|uniref:cellulose synthase-like protein G2 isoform X2 n=1 Tax=Salvia hispanica TaxID=49212 RepID=UPI002009CDDE|nr:cellulose synthase-like protein G2 isoform X2 [Salvia hispanica]